MTNKYKIQSSRSGKTIYGEIKYRFVNHGNWPAQIAIKVTELFLKNDSVYLCDLQNNLNLHLKFLKRTKTISTRETV
jgi:hypothetical protein